MKIDSQAHTKNVGLILFTLLSLSNSIAYGQELQNNNLDAQLTHANAAVFQSKSTAVERNKLELKVALAALPDKQKRPTIDKLSNKSALTDVKVLPNKQPLESNGNGHTTHSASNID